MEPQHISKLISLMSNFVKDDANESQIDELFKQAEETLQVVAKFQKYDLLYSVENLFITNVLKQFEDEASYSRFYESMNLALKNCTIETPEIDLNQNQVKFLKQLGFIFVLHTANQLAHTKILHDSISNSPSNLRKKTAVFLLSKSNKEFEDRWRMLGVSVISTDKSFMDSLAVLKNFQKVNSNLKITWMCSTLGLRIATATLKNLNWWSVKLHPPIDGVKRYIGDMGHGESFIYRGKKWTFFKAPHKLENASKNKIKFSIRQNAFGTFTRDELIDTTDHWKNIETILHTVPNLRYFYAAKKEIHKDVPYLTPLNDRIFYLGWLDNPSDYIRKMCFLLDPFPYGHGSLLREAIAASVPVVYQTEAISANSAAPINKLIMASGRNFTNNVKARTVLVDGKPASLETNFSSRIELSEKIKLLMLKNYNEKVGAAYQFILPKKSSWKAEILKSLIQHS